MTTQSVPKVCRDCGVPFDDNGGCLCGEAGTDAPTAFTFWGFAICAGAFFLAGIFDIIVG